MNQRQLNPRIRPNQNAVMLASCVMALLTPVLIGCERDLLNRDKSLPAPLPTTLPYEFRGKIFRIWGGDYFDIRTGQLLHYVCLQGIDSPKPGQPFYIKAREELKRIIGDQELRVIVTRLDDSKVAFAKVWIPGSSSDQPEVDVGLEMLRRGFGWFDGNEFEGDREYQAAQASAQAAKLGLWSQPNPMPPWEFDANQ